MAEIGGSWLSAYAQAQTGIHNKRETSSGHSAGFSAPTGGWSHSIVKTLLAGIRFMSLGKSRDDKLFFIKSRNSKMTSIA
jgi:hypothetical protein